MSAKYNKLHKKRPPKEQQKQYSPDLEVSKEDFNFVQKDEKIFDKKFETKPIGYFRDAMTRFAKNRTNLYATIILFSLIMMSILVPALTTKRYTGQEVELRFLPPKVPIIENFGFLDGTQHVRDQTVDRSTIDPETGLGIPFADQYDPEFILMDTVENYTISCTSRREACYGGLNLLELQGDYVATILSHQTFTFNSANDPILVVEIDSMTEDAGSIINLFVRTDSDLPEGIYDEAIGQITTAGRHEFHLNDILGDDFETISSNLQLQLDSNDNEARVYFESISLYSGDTESDPLIHHWGYELSQYSRPINNADFTRRGGEVLMASFRFDSYERALGHRRERAYSAEEYYALIEENEDRCERSDDPDNPRGWLFSEGCPVVKVNRQNEVIIRDGVEYYTYDLVLDYGIYRGFDETPYFYFGTDMAGRDLFALSWLALRTSLFLGVVISIINITIGIIYGAIEGYYGGKVDLMMERFAEVIGRIPWLVTLSIFVALLGPGFLTLIFILVFSGWIGISSITRTQFYRYKGREYVLASRTLGAKDSRLIFRHILPNAIGTIITMSILSIPLVIFAESTISYLGFGIGHGVSFSILGVEFSGVSIGVLMADGRNHMFARPYLTVFPAIIISILMITFNMFGNALRDAFNPTLRGSE